MESSTVIPHVYHTADGWFDFSEFYRQIAEWIPDGGRWVEVGVYAGKSFSFAVVECLNRGKKIDFVAVDIFPCEWIYIGNKPPVRQMFDKTMETLAGHYRVEAGASVDVARRFENGSVDFVFIDAAHDYESVIDDVTAWLQKVRPGGIIAGHDYEPDYHGLMRAVGEIFGNQVELIPYDDDKTKHCWKVQL